MVLASEGSALTLNVVKGTLVVLEEWGELLEAFRMEFIDEADVSRAEQIFVDQGSAVRSHCQVVPHVKVLVLGMLHAHDDVLDTDAELSLLVEAGLVRDAHTLCEFEFVAAANSIGALMHTEV